MTAQWQFPRYCALGPFEWICWTVSHRGLVRCWWYSGWFGLRIGRLELDVWLWL